MHSRVKMCVSLLAIATLLVAAGRISDRDLLWIILIAIGIIVLAVALR